MHTLTLQVLYSIVYTDRLHLQVLCDILSTGGLPGGAISTQPPLFFANDDLSYQVSLPFTFRVSIDVCNHVTWIITDHAPLKVGSIPN